MYENLRNSSTSWNLFKSCISKFEFSIFSYQFATARLIEEKKTIINIIRWWTRMKKRWTLEFPTKSPSPAMLEMWWQACGKISRRNALWVDFWYFSFCLQQQKPTLFLYYSKEQSCMNFCFQPTFLVGHHNLWCLARMFHKFWCSTAQPNFWERLQNMLC